jgi:hypothetical protein
LLLALHGLQARDVPAHLRELIGLRRLARGTLHAQRELLFAQLQKLIGELDFVRNSLASIIESAV